MPIKPTLTFTFATDATFGSGPATGEVTRVIPPSLLQGFIPGTGVASEHVNYLENINGDWITNWLLVGTFDPDEDAHLVETDADGLISSTRSLVGGSTVGGAIPSARVTGPSAGDAPSLSVTFGSGPNRALNVSQSSAGSSASAAFIQNTDGTGEVLEVVSAGSNTGRGVSIITQDDNEAPLRLVGRNLPTAPALGDMYVDDTTDEERLRVFHNSQFNSVWTTANGIVRGYNESIGESTTSAGGTLISKVGITIPASAGLVVGSTVHLRGVCEMGANIPTTTACQYGLRDSTSALDIVAARAVTIFTGTGIADERFVTVTADYVIPASGARTLFLGFISNGAIMVFIRNATLEITGQY